MKQVYFFLFLFFSPVLLFAQQPDSVINKDSGIEKDSSSTTGSPFLQHSDTVSNKSDSIIIKKMDTVISQSVVYNINFQKILKENRFLNSEGKPISMVTQTKNRHFQDSYFYLLAMLAILLGFFRFFYTRYFNNLFRVFFNASLRQSQLTDQLLLAKLPSLFFNILFILTGGIFVYLLLRYYNLISEQSFWSTVFYCTVSLGVIYLIKFISLKFTGWLTGYNEITNTYIFIIFLINKILGILLIPFTIIIAFSMPALATASVIISLLFTGLMILLRLFRSYGLLQHKLKVSKFHFFLYVVGIEIVPVLLIYKGLVLLLSKNL